MLSKAQIRAVLDKHDIRHTQACRTDRCVCDWMDRVRAAQDGTA